MGIGLMAGLCLGLFGSFAAQLFFVFPNWIAAAWLTACAIAVVWLHRSARELVGLQSPETLRVPFAVGGILFTLTLGLGLSGLVQLWRGPVPFPFPLPPGNPLEAYTTSLEGWLTFSLYAVAVGPLIEEVAFRGWVQRSIQRRFGAVIGIGAGAVLFAFFHLWYVEPAVVIVPLMLGIVWGVAALVTGSVFAAIVLHGAWNGLLMVIHRSGVDPNLFWNLDGAGAAAPILMIVSSIVVLGYLARKLWQQMQRSGIGGLPVRHVR